MLSYEAVRTHSVSGRGRVGRYLRVPGQRRAAQARARYGREVLIADGAGLARWKWTAQCIAARHGKAAAEAAEQRSQAPAKEEAQRGKKAKDKSTATMGLGLKTGMQFETQPHAAARLIGPGRQPLQPAQRHRGAVVRPKQRTSSLNKPCRALFSPAIPRCHPPRAPPKDSKRPSQAAVVQQPPPPTNHRCRRRRQCSSAPRVSWA